MIPVILCGGVGTRLKPLSSTDQPKQFLALNSDKSMLQETLERLKYINGVQPPILVTGNQYEETVYQHIASSGDDIDVLLLEPSKRNTAPAISVAVWQSIKNGDDPTLIVFPTDHVMEAGDEFVRSMELAAQAAQGGHIVTFGVKPTYAHTGYGYIQASKGAHVRTVEKFTEKPDLITAEKFLSQGSYYWNSGIFCFKASTYIKELKKHNADIEARSRAAVEKATQIRKSVYLHEEEFSACPDISIDYALMEKTDRAVMVPLNVEWNDIGTWEMLEKVCDIKKGEAIAPPLIGKVSEEV